MSGSAATLSDGQVVSRKVDLEISTAEVATSQSTTSTSYTDMSTVGPAVTLSPGITQDHLILLYGYAQTAGALMSVAIAGATALDKHAIEIWATGASRVGTSHVHAAAQTTGVTHTNKYRIASGTATFADRRLTGIAL